MDTLETEARIFTRYLIGASASPQVVQIYSAAMASSKPSSKDAKRLQFMVAHPRSIGFIDAGLVFLDPTSEARRRLYVLLAILEANPAYCNSFLAVQRGPLYVIAIAYSGVRGIVRAVCGLILVKAIA